MKEFLELLIPTGQEAKGPKSHCGQCKEEKKSNAPVRNQITISQSTSQKPSYAQNVHTIWYTKKSCNKFDVSCSLNRSVRSLEIFVVHTKLQSSL
jgi:hypothetical protein